MPKMSVSLGLFIAGACCFLLIFFLPYQTWRPLTLVGATIWGAAYLSVLWDNYKKRAPVPTRGGKVTYEESPRMYNFHYVFLAIFGLSFVSLRQACVGENN